MPLCSRGTGGYTLMGAIPVISPNQLSVSYMSCLFLAGMSHQQHIVEQARKAFQTGKSKDLTYRITQLKNLRRLISERQTDIVKALKNDLYKVGSVHVKSQNVFVWLYIIGQLSDFQWHFLWLI